MIINQAMAQQNISRYRLCKVSGVPQATINDICNGKTDLQKCTAGTLYKIAKALKLTVEQILEESPSESESRLSFNLFTGNVCHQIKEKGDIDFIVETLESNQIRKLYNRRWYPEALYLLAAVDYLSRVNGIPLYSAYQDIRKRKLKKKLYPSSLVLIEKIAPENNEQKWLEDHAIPEFKRFNIMESEIRNVV
ncbi:MAG: helix-turn-helix domain-containing protein [Bilifractor sp.]